MNTSTTIEEHPSDKDIINVFPSILLSILNDDNVSYKNIESRINALKELFSELKNVDIWWDSKVMIHYIHADSFVCFIENTNSDKQNCHSISLYYLSKDFIFFLDNFSLMKWEEIEIIQRLTKVFPDLKTLDKKTNDIIATSSDSVDKCLNQRGS